MNRHQLGSRERVLSIWANNRLNERETIDWAVGALKTIRGQLGNDMVALFRFLDDHAKNSGVGPDFTTLWRLFRLAAEDSTYSDGFMVSDEFKEKIDQGAARLEDIDQLIECFRPRLKVEPLSSYDEAKDTPLSWVHWGFETSFDQASRSSGRIGKQQMQSLSAELLHMIAEKGTYALRQALNVCKEIGWIRDGSDIPNYMVHRVFDLEEEDAGEDDDEDKDPDAYNNSFAPIVRLLSLALSTLAGKDRRLASRTVNAWEDLSNLSGLFLRLAAFGSWNTQVRSHTEAGKFLISMPSYSFWRWTTFPEVATLRATRWNELDESVRDLLSKKLLSGPDDSAFTADGQIDYEAKIYHRDHEIARLVDSGSNIDKSFIDIVEQRRASDPEFPAKVPAIELGIAAATAMWAPPGKPDKFDDVSTTKLIATLIGNSKARGFGAGDDAEAFARTLSGKFRILEALALIEPTDPLFDSAFDLLVSFPHENAEDSVGDRDIAQRIVSLALTLSADSLSTNASRLCYWLDATDARLPRLDDIEDLWSRLLPFAEELANRKGETEHYTNESHLTMAALNEPLGHLLSFVLRRCHPILEGTDSLPRHLFGALKGLSGRACELWANRMAVSMNYFVLVDREWLNKIVINPMMETGAISDRLWEAFARYSKVPSPTLWAALQASLLKRLYSVDLTPDSRRRLSEMCVIVWIWSCRGHEYNLKPANLRRSLSLVSDDVRAAAAWQFAAIFFRAKHDGQNDQPIDERWKEIGNRFFEEVWPLEPTLQSASSANDFAQIPASVGPRYFANAVSIVAPFLVPFKVWSVQSAFRLKIEKPWTEEIIQLHPEELLTLLSLSINEEQVNRVHDLGALLDRLIQFHPALESDYRVQRLQKMTARDN